MGMRGDAVDPDEAATSPGRNARNNVQRVHTMKKAGFTPAFFITSSWALWKRRRRFQSESIVVKRADTPDFVRVVAHA